MPSGTFKNMMSGATPTPSDPFICPAFSRPSNICGTSRGTARSGLPLGWHCDRAANRRSAPGGIHNAVRANAKLIFWQSDVSPVRVPAAETRWRRFKAELETNRVNKID